MVLQDNDEHLIENNEKKGGNMMSGKIRVLFLTIIVWGILGSLAAHAATSTVKITQGIYIKLDPIYEGEPDNFDFWFEIKNTGVNDIQYDNLCVAVLDANGNFLRDLYCIGSFWLSAGDTKIIRQYPTTITEPEGDYQLVGKINYQGNWNDISTYSTDQQNPVWFEVVRRLPPPTGVTASNGTHTNRITILWNPVNDATHYKVYRNTTSNPGGAVSVSDWQVSASFNDYDYNTTACQDFYYWVKAAASNSGYRASDFSAGDLGWRALPKPINVQATDGTYTDRVRVTWNSVVDAHYYRVYRNANDGPNGATALGSWQSINSYYDDNITPGHTYNYWVKASTVNSEYRASDFSSPDEGYAGDQTISTRFNGSFFEDQTAKIGIPILLEAKLEESNSPNSALVGETVHFEIYYSDIWHEIPDDGKDETSFITDSDGIASVYYTPPKNLSTGEFQIRARYNGNESYDACDLTRILNIIKPKWLVLIYLCADNNLEPESVEDFYNEIWAARNNDQVSICILYDRADGQTTTQPFGEPDWSTARYYRISNTNLPFYTDWGEVNMGSPNILQQFVDTASSECEADHTALILWNHGSGWKGEDLEVFKAVCVDDTGDRLLLSEIRGVLDSFTNGGDNKIDLIGYDACLMGMIEVAYEMAPYAKYFVASEDEETGDGWEYHLILGVNAISSNTTPLMFGQVIVDQSIQFTLGCWDLSQTDLRFNEIVTMSTRLNELINNSDPDIINVITDARDSSRKFGVDSFIDLRQFANEIANETSDTALQTAAQSLASGFVDPSFRVRWQSTLSDSDTLGGLSIYFPANTDDPGYSNYFQDNYLLFTTNNDQQWDEFLQSYFNSNRPENPVISSISPNNGALGTLVIITGSNFGSTQGSVTFNGINAAIDSWSDIEIQTIVPSGATTGPLVVHSSEGAISNSVTFTVKLVDDPFSTPQNISSDSSQNVAETDLAVDSSNTLHVVWSGDYNLFYRKKMGENWGNIDQLNTNSSIKTNGENHVLIDVGPNNKPHIIYKSTNDDLYYMYDNGTNFTSPINITNSGNVIWYRMAVDTNENVHLIFRDTSYQVYYRKISGGSIDNSASETLWTTCGDTIGIAVASPEDIYAFRGCDGISYRRFNNGSWETSQSLTTTSGDGYPCAEVDSNGTVHLIWRNSTSENKGIWYGTLDNAGVFSTPILISTYAGLSDFTLDKNDSPVVSNIMSDGPDTYITIIKETNGDWSYKVVSTAEQSADDPIPVVVDSNNIIHVLYTGWESGNKVVFYTCGSANWIETFTISGIVTFDGSGLENVVMAGLPGNPTTNSEGFYTATVNEGWSGTVTPTLSGYAFTNPSTTYTNVTSNQTTNYTANLLTFTISGTVTFNGSGLENVVMNGIPGNSTTNSEGFYTATVNYGWSGTVTPALTGYIFTEPSTTYTNVTSNQTTNYTAALLTVSISGTVIFNGSGLENVVMNGFPGNPTTNSEGFYTATVNYGWSGTVTPNLTGYTFTEPSTTYINVTSNQTTNYTANLLTFTISGTVTFNGSGLENVVMNGLPGNPTTNSEGFYTATVDYGWSGIVTPNLAGYTFTEPSTTYTNVTSNQTTNYTSTLLTISISGTVTFNGSGLENVVMNGLPGNPTTNSEGFYTATVNYGWSGTVTPALTGYTFTDPSTTYTNVTSDQTTNYTATLLSPIPTSERNAIIDLYNSTNGDNWFDNSGWKEGENFAMPGTEDTWYGITVENIDGENHVTRIELGFNNLNGTIPVGIGDLNRLNYLSLSNNDLSGNIPTEIGSLQYIQILYLSSNEFTGSIPVPPNLTHLYLDDNHLSGPLPPELGNLSNLKNLSLQSNMFIGEIPPCITNLTDLEYLDIGYNGLYTDDEALKDFLDEKDPDWETTQTIAPFDITVANVACDSIQLNWTPIIYTQDEGRYEVLYGTTPGGPYPGSVKTSDKTASSMIVTGLAQSTTYYFIIQTCTEPHSQNKNTVCSEPGNEVSEITPLCPPSITVTTPNGGESWEVGSTQTITWTAINIEGNVIIEYSPDGGNSYNEIESIPVDDGSYNWTVPDTPSENCLVRISSGTSDDSPSDTSDEVFSIVSSPSANITVTSPNGGESWEVGSIHEITWTSFGFSGEIKIEYSVDNRYSWTTIVTSTDNDGNYKWIVPNSPANNCFIRISRSDADEDISDVSDEAFLIVPASSPIVTVISPNGGEHLTVGTLYNITWASSENFNDAAIEFSGDNGTTWTDLMVSTPNDGIFEWTVPDSPSGSCLIRISDTNGETSDVSDAVFSIVPPTNETVTIISPNGGESWEAGSSHEITWGSSGTIENIIIEYSINNGASWIIIVEGLPDNGSYNWTIPDTPSEECLVRISGGTSDEAPSDTSDTVFSIASAAALTLTAPNGEEILRPGENFLIQWKSGQPIEYVKLEYSPDNGSTYLTIEDDVPNSGYYEWQIPHHISSNCLVRVSDADGREPLRDSLLYEFKFKIIGCELSPTDSEAFIMWLGDTANEALTLYIPKISFIRNSNGNGYIKFNEMIKEISTWPDQWQSLKVLIHQETQWVSLWLNSRIIFENLPLLPGSIFAPVVSLSVGPGGIGGIEIDNFAVRVSNSAKTKNSFITLFEEDFENFQVGDFPEKNGWESIIVESKKKSQAIYFEEISPGVLIDWDFVSCRKVLTLQPGKENQVVVVKYFNIPEYFPFDISDKQFSIVHSQDMETFPQDKGKK